MDESIAHKTDDIKGLYGHIGHDFNDLTKYNITDILDSRWYKSELEASWDKMHPLHLPRCYLTCGDNGKRAVIKNVE